MSDKVIIIEEYDNPHRADMARLRLEAEGIPVFLENRFIVETDWFLANAVGNIRLQVPEAFVEHARQVLSTIKKPASDMSDRPEISGDLKCLNCGKAMAETDEVCSECGWSYQETDENSEGTPSTP